MQTLTVAIEAGEFLLKSANRTYEVRGPDGAFLGVVHEVEDGWRVPTYADSPAVFGTFASADEAVAAMHKYSVR